MNQILTDENIQLIANRMVELLEENAGHSEVQRLEGLLRENEKKKENILRAIENGIFSPALNTRLDELEEESLHLESEIARQKLKITIPDRGEIVSFLMDFAKNKKTPRKKSLARWCKM